ncbi:MAG: CRISPR-associated endonuclease Cas2 [Saprospiraceae bacterium]|nr:CRISPR-associated endonuclease Cas2 [Saprospiraceae bacterium]
MNPKEYLICYDITSDSLRNRLLKYLKKQKFIGLQKSVYLCSGTATKIRNLHKFIIKNIPIDSINDHICIIELQVIQGHNVEQYGRIFPFEPFFGIREIRFY